MRTDASCPTARLSLERWPSTPPPRDDGLVRVITNGSSRKVAHVRDQRRAVVGQVDGPRWLSLEGSALVSTDPARVAEAVRRYALRYRQPAVNPSRVVIEITIDRVLGRP